MLVEASEITNQLESSITRGACVSPISVDMRRVEAWEIMERAIPVALEANCLAEPCVATQIDNATRRAQRQQMFIAVRPPRQTLVGERVQVGGA